MQQLNSCKNNDVTKIPTKIVKTFAKIFKGKNIQQNNKGNI